MPARGTLLPRHPRQVTSDHWSEAEDTCLMRVYLSSPKAQLPPKSLDGVSATSLTSANFAPASWLATRFAVRAPGERHDHEPDSEFRCWPAVEPHIQQCGHAQETKLSVMVFRGGQNLPLFAAQEKGFLAKRGLTVNVTFAPSADELPRVLSDGRVQIIHSTSDNAVKIADVDKLDVALVVGGDNAHNHIIAQQDIQSLADLRGKTIVLDTSTSGYAYVLYAILKRNGLNKGDYILETGGRDATSARGHAERQERRGGRAQPSLLDSGREGRPQRHGLDGRADGSLSKARRATSCARGRRQTATPWSSICKPISRVCAGRSIRPTRTPQSKFSAGGWN